MDLGIIKCDIKGQFYKEITVKITLLWSLIYNFFVKSMVKTLGTITWQCYIQVSVKKSLHCTFISSGYKVGCVSEERHKKVCQIAKGLDENLNLLDSIMLPAFQWYDKIGKMYDKQKTHMKR